MSLLGQQSGPSLPPGGMGNSPLAGAVGASPGGDPSAAASPGGAGGNPLLAGVLAQTLGQQAKIGQTDFIGKQVSNLTRLVGIMIAHVDQTSPDVARHLVNAWRALDQARNAIAKKKENQSDGPGGSPAGPPLGFSGAKMAGSGGPGASPSPIP